MRVVRWVVASGSVPFESPLYGSERDPLTTKGILELIMPFDESWVRRQVDLIDKGKTGGQRRRE